MVGFGAVPGPQFSYGLQAGHNGTASSVLSHNLSQNGLSQNGYGIREISPHAPKRSAQPVGLSPCT